MLNAQLPTHIGPAADADLPTVYANARTALAEAASIDECRDWIDRAKALAVYARQAEDHMLESLAQKIRARAFVRMGEVWKAIENEHGLGAGRPSQKDKITHDHECVILSAKQEAAKAAGLPYGTHPGGNTIQTATNIAAIDPEDLEDLLEGQARPPTISELSKRGAQAKKDAKISKKPITDWTITDYLKAGKIPPEHLQRTDEYQRAHPGLLGRTEAEFNAAFSIVNAIRQARKALADIDPENDIAVLTAEDTATIIAAATDIAKWLAAINGRISN